MDFGALLEILDEGIALFDPPGRLTYFNSALPSLFGLTFSELLARGAPAVLSIGLREDGMPFADGGHPVQVAAATGVTLSRVLLRVPLPDHAPRWLAMRCRPVTLPGDQGFSVVMSVTDATQQQLTLEAFREGEGRFRAMAESAPVLISMTDADGQFLYVNRGWADLTGRGREELVGEGWVQSLHPADRSGHLAALRRALRSNEGFTFESRVRGSSGDFRWLLHRGAPRMPGQWAHDGYIVFGIDIEERRRAEARRSTIAATTEIFTESLQSEAAVSRLLAVIGQGMEYDACEFWTLDPGSDLLELCDIWGAASVPTESGQEWAPGLTLPLGSGLAGAVWDSGHVTLTSGAAAGQGELSLGAYAVGVPVKSGGGDLLGVLVFRASQGHRLSQDLQMLEEFAARLGQFFDHRRAEDSSTHAEHFRGAILESLPASVALLNREGTVLAVNESWRRSAVINGGATMFGESGRNYLRILDGVSGPGAEQAREAAGGIQAVLARETDRFELLYPFRTPNEDRWFRMIVSSLPEGLGSGAIVMHLDVTDSRRAETALAASEARYRLLSRATSEVIYEWDIQADRWIWSEGLGRVLGGENPERSATGWYERVHPEDRDRITRSLDEALSGSAEIWSGLYRVRRANGTYSFVADRGYVVRNESGTAIRMIGAISDITLRKAAEQQIQRSEAALAAAQKVAQVGSWELDLTDGSAVWSAEMYRILGLEGRPGPVPATLLLEYVHPADRPALSRAIDDALSKATPFDLEFRIVRPNGSVREVHARTQTTTKPAGPPTFAIGAIQDVTDQREAERKLLQRGERLRLLNSIATGIRAPATMAQVIGYVVRELHEHFPECRATYSSVDSGLRLRVIGCAQPPRLADLTGFEAELPRSAKFLECLRRRGPIVLEHPDSDPDILPVLRGANLGSATALAMPLLLNDELIGILTLAAVEARTWGEHEKDVLREVGDYLSVAIAEVRAKEERERAVRALEASQAQLRDLARQLQVAREKERTRIAREIHDELGQSLTALRMETTLLVHRRAAGRADGRKLLGLIDGTIESVQRLAADLRPSLLDDLDLSAAILWEVGELQNRTGIRCECELPPAVESLSSEHSTTIFRVMQEALTNVARHAQADVVRVRLGIADGMVTLEVSDNGIGLPAEAMHQPNSLGLLGMRERALALHGRCEIASTPGEGTQLSLILPLTGAPPAKECR
jgi:PAS domain S-box-containing protein